MKDLIRKIRRTANWGLYGSIAVVLVAVIFHFSPWHITYQSAQVSRWMLISGAIILVGAVVLHPQGLAIKAPAQLAQMLEPIMGPAAKYIMGFALLGAGFSSLPLLMITILLVLLLFLSYPNMYKMKNDLGLTDDEMTSLFGSNYVRDPQPDNTDLLPRDNNSTDQ